MTRRFGHLSPTLRFATGLSMIAWGVSLLALAGCTLSTSTGGVTTDGDEQPAPTAPEAFSVTLSVSNSTPQLNEEVVLRCTPVGDIGQGASFAFETIDVDLQVDVAGGTATFIVTESELGQGVDVTCSGTDVDGTTATSSRATIFPTGL